MDTTFDPLQPLVLLIGDVDSEGITSSLKATNQQYKIKRLHSKPSNWAAIIDYFNDYNIRCVIMKFTGVTYEHFDDPEYQAVRDQLFTRLGKIPHVIFIHDDLFTTDETEASSSGAYRTPEDEEGYYLAFHKPSGDTCGAVKEYLIKQNLNILTYTKNAEMTFMASVFLKEAEEGLLYRIYVPSDRLWSNETDRLIQLFRDYLTRIGQLSVRLDQHRTKQGIIYEFFQAKHHTNERTVDQPLATQFEEFSEFLDLVISNPNQAELILKSKSISPSDIVPILTRYAKESKRLQIDMKHEREQKILSIQQRLESDLLDELPSDTDLQEIHAIVNSSVPALSGIHSALNNNLQYAKAITPKNREISININPQYINAINSVISQEIQGDKHLTEHDQELLRLINEHRAKNSADLSSAVYELSDDSVSQSHRLIAKQKLKAFLLCLGEKASEIGIRVLQTYIENKLGI